MKTHSPFSDEEMAEVLQLGEMEAADRLVETRREMESVLPKFVFDELRMVGRKSVPFQIIAGQVAIRSVCGWTTRAYLTERDKLILSERAHSRCAKEALQSAVSYEKTASVEGGIKAQLLTAMAARLRNRADAAHSVVLAMAASEVAIASLLHVQMRREEAKRDGKPPEAAWLIPEGACSGAVGGELQLVPLGVGGGSGGESEAGASTEAPKLDALGFLDIDR